MSKRKVYLHGELGDKFGSEFSLDVKSPSEAIRLLCCNFPELRKHLVETQASYHVYAGEVNLSQNEVTLTQINQEPFHFIPAVEGSGDVGKIILGAVLMYFAGPLGQALGGELITAAAIESVAFGIGTNLVLGGISGLLFAPPKPDKPDEGAEKPSYSFDGPVNTVRQGNCIPVGYGRVRVGSQVISSGFYNTRI